MCRPELVAACGTRLGCEALGLARRTPEQVFDLTTAANGHSMRLKELPRTVKG